MLLDPLGLERRRVRRRGGKHCGRGENGCREAGKAHKGSCRRLIEEWQKMAVRTTGVRRPL
jgi:hypothetical protein